MITALLIGAGALYLLRKKNAQAIGKVERIKRRIYKEVSLAQQAGVDFSKKFPELTTQERSALERVGKDVGWKQSKRSIESGKPYVESYYGSLRRAWNAVSGIAGIGATAYDVRDTNNNVVLTWYDVTDHIQHEPEAKTLLALPPHVEQKKPKAKKASKKATKEQEYAERAEFADTFIEDWLQKHPNSYLNREGGIDKEYPEGDGLTIREMMIEWFAHGTMKYKQDKRYAYSISVYFDKWYNLGTEDNGYGQLAYEMIEGWKNRHITDGFAREDLDDIRRELLDKAKHMELIFFDKETQDWVNVKGDERYNYLDKINWVMMVYQSYHNSAADTTESTVYPIRAFNEKMEAELFGWKPKTGRDKADVLTSTRSIKVIPIFDVNVQAITGLN